LRAGEYGEKEADATEMTQNAYAKLNLTLDIVGVRADGYHDLRMVMQSIELHDTVRIREKCGADVAVECAARFVPRGSDNLAARAAERFFVMSGVPRRGLSISIDKVIPVCAGMAGGSADAAAVLLAMRRMYAPQMSAEELCGIGAAVGSDVPYCVFGGTALAEGRGEILTRLAPMPRMTAVVCKPDFPISTPELFALSDTRRITLRPDTEGVIKSLEGGNAGGVARRLYNVFENVLPKKYGEIGRIKDRLLGLGAEGACMTGSGSAVFGLFEDGCAAARAYESLSAEYAQTFLTATRSEPNV
jgi:4-diphosphocytidyl-2-C-methyl-D-erythritol kinase